MTWESVGVILAAIGLAMGWLDSRNKHRLKASDESTRLATLENNETLLEKINGKYVKSDLLEVRIASLRNEFLVTEARLISKIIQAGVYADESTPDDVEAKPRKRR